MKVCFVVMLSDSKKILYSFELFVSSLRRHGGLEDVEFRTVMSGSKYEPSRFMRSIMKPEHYAFHDNDYRIECFQRWFVETSADVVVFADADLIFMNSIHDILEWAIENQKVCGCTAYGSPFRSASDNVNMEVWKSLYDWFGLTCKQWTKTTTGGIACPYGYFNGGFIVFPADLFNEAKKHTTVIENHHRFMPDFLRKINQNYHYSPQMSNLFCFDKIGLPYFAIDPKYNCWSMSNIPNDVRVIHMTGAWWENKQQLASFLRTTNHTHLKDRYEEFMEIASDAELLSNCKLL